MQQVLFYVPFTAGLVPPDGLPVYGFGAMLFLTFVVTAMVWGPLRAVRVGLPKDKLQDLAIVLFITGIAGARVVYMIQYADQFPHQLVPLVLSFFEIWNGGIVFYGSVFGGAVGYVAFYWFVLRRFRVSGWKLADAIAPLVAAGLAVGRIGCYLNGCCWGQPVCEEATPMPLVVPALGEFPLLTAHARGQVVFPAEANDRLPQIHGLQTSTGFAAGPREARLGAGDPRTVVAAVEPGSPAERAGLQAGDRVVDVNGEANRIVVEVSGEAADVVATADKLVAAGGVPYTPAERTPRPNVRRVAFEAPELYRAAVAAAGPLPAHTEAHDVMWELARDWPRGRSKLDLVVDRGGQRVPLSFTPRTVAFFPTQLYETVSMVLLIFLLLAYQPFRRHDGQVMVLLMVGYAAHRFLNEAIRIEPTYLYGLTLSQLISVGILAAAVALELYLRWAMPKLPPGEVPLSYGVTAAPPTPAPVA